MSVLRDSTNQVRSAFSTMPVSSRITTALMALMIVGALAYLATTERAPSTELLFGGRALSEQELDSLEMSFSRAGLNDWKREGRRISIPTLSKNQYLAALETASSLPISIRSSVQEAIDKTTIFESSSQRLAREMHAKEQDLGNKLTAFPEIRWASVEYDMGERQGLSRTRTQSASVVVCPEGTDCLPPARIRMIQDFIRGSYAGMNADDVVVIDTNTSATSANHNDLAHRQKRETEARLEQQVHDILSDYGDIRVAAYLELSKASLANETTSDYSASRSSIESSAGGLKTQAIQPNLNVRPVRGNRATRLHSDIASMIPPVVSVPLEPMPIDTNRVRVSVGLPESYYHRVWRSAFAQQNPGKPLSLMPSMTTEQKQHLQAQTRANIQSAVLPALMASAAEASATPELDIWDYPDLIASDSVGASTTAMITAWLSLHWQQVSLVIFGIVGLSVASRALRHETTKNVPAASSRIGDHPLTGDSRHVDSTKATPAQASGGLQNAVMQHASVDPPCATVGRPSFEDQDLLALIEQNPDAAVGVIQTWIRKAA